MAPTPLRLLAVLALLLPLPALCVAAPRPQQSVVKPPSRLSGTVTDINGAYVVGANILVEGGGSTRAILSDGEGEYAVSVLAGEYRIQVKSVGFCVARRPAFRVRPATPVIFNFTLVVCPIVNTIISENGKYTGETDSLQPPYREEKFSVRSSRGALDLIIQFGERQDEGNVIEYLGYPSSITYAGIGENPRREAVLVSYDLLTVSADVVHLDKKSFEIEAHGNVTLVIEDRVFNVQDSIIQIHDGAPVIKYFSVTSNPIHLH